MGQGLEFVIYVRYRLYPSHPRPPPFHPDSIPVGSGWKGGGCGWRGSIGHDLRLRRLQCKSGIGFYPHLLARPACELAEPLILEFGFECRVHGEEQDGASNLCQFTDT